MKKPLLLALLATTATAEVTQEKCEQVSMDAQSIMISRQNGGLISDMMRQSEGDKLARKMVAEAFNEREYSLDKMKRKSVDEFKNKWSIGCYKLIK